MSDSPLWREVDLGTPASSQIVAGGRARGGDSSIYLACMGEGDQTQANLVHADPAGGCKEITSFPGRLHQLGHAASRDIFAGGFRRNDQGGTDKGVMLIRSP